MPKKRYQVIRRKTNVDSIEGMKFGRSNAFTVSDPGMAEHIEKSYGPGKGGTGDVLVYPDDQTDRRLEDRHGIHHYMFAVPTKTWKSTPSSGTWVQRGVKWVYVPSRSN